MKWWHFALIIGLLGGGWWLYRYLATPPPGMPVPDMGREHVTAAQVALMQYNSEPPTSGPHLTTWVKAGIYQEPQNEGELIHSLEHGYVIISYNCGVHLKESTKSQVPNPKKIQNSQFKIQKVLAHEEEGSASGDLTIPREATGSAINNGEPCQTLIKQLEDLAKRKKLWKLIVAPRPQLDTTIAITAWGYLDKFDPPAGGFDASRLERFIDYHRDQGPEKTME